MRNNVITFTRQAGLLVGPETGTAQAGLLPSDEALSRQDRYEEALQALSQGESRDAEQAKFDIRYRLPRARVLLECGRLEEAQSALDAAGEGAGPDERFYRLAIQRDLAGKLGQDEERQRRQDEMMALFAQAAPELDDPVFRHFYTAAVAEILNLEVPPLPKARAATTFAQWSEGLERLRRREPDNQALRLVSIGDLKRLQEDATRDELFIQPICWRNRSPLSALRPTGSS